MDHFLGRNDEQIQCRGILHIVEAGDTLYKIGKKYGVPLSRVMYANPYVNVYNLQPGDEICVPVMTPRMPMGKDNIPQQMDQNRMTPVQENRMGGQVMPMRQQRHTAPAADGRREGMHNAAHGNRMGFPLAPLEEVIVDVAPEAEGGTSMGNRMAAAEETARGSMRKAVPKPEEDQSMRNQPDTGNLQEREDSNRRENGQNPSEPAEASNPDREYAPGAEGCTEKGKCVGRRDSKALPWDDPGVSDQMMHEYLQDAPR